MMTSEQIPMTFVKEIKINCNNCSAPFNVKTYILPLKNAFSTVVHSKEILLCIYYCTSACSAVNHRGTKNKFTFRQS